MKFRRWSALLYSRKKRFPFILVVISLVFCHAVSSQTSIDGDSLKVIWRNEQNSDSLRFKAINIYYRNYTFSQPDSVLFLTKEHSSFAQEKANIKEVANAYNERSYAYYLKGELDSSMVSLQKSIHSLSQLDDSIALASVYANIGNIYGEQNKYEDALGYFTKTLKIFEERNVPTGKARMLTNIGLIFYLIDSYDLSLEYFGRALSIYRSLDLDRKTGTILTEIGSVFYEQGMYQKAIEKADSAQVILLESNNKFALADCYFLKAKSYLKLGDRENARIYVDKSLFIDNQIKNDAKVIERLTFDAELYFDNNISLATQKAEDIVSLLKLDTKNELKVNLFDLLHRCYKAQNRYNTSLQMLEKANLYGDSLEIQKSKIAIVRKAVQIAYEDKLLDIQMASQRTQVLQRKSYSRGFYMVSILCLVVIAAILFHSRSQIRASNREREQLLEELEMLKSNDSAIVAETNSFELDRVKIENYINRKLNETDWKVLLILLEDPVISNKDIAKKAVMSIDGIGSSLRRMYEYFEIKESKYKKISLLMLTIKLSNT